MINKVVRLVRPKRFDAHLTNVEYSDREIVIRPTFMSICHADQRYYNGVRASHILEQKLPMSLIHEAIGEVLFDSRGEFKAGERCVMIPCVPGFIFNGKYSKACLDEKIGENYCRQGIFMSSGADGFMQEVVFQPRDRIIKLPTELSNEIAAFTELMSVAVHSIKRFLLFSNTYRSRIGVWGDGNLGFIVTRFLKIMMPECSVTVFGKHDDKLQLFHFADEIVNLNDENKERWTMNIEHAFECTGGEGCEYAINDIIDILEPGGTINTLGVSEHPISINTRLLLEKGLHILGHSRSGLTDFEYTVSMFCF
jgi:ribitol-5-phosphate 2-dehydrogenase